MYHYRTEGDRSSEKSKMYHEDNIVSAMETVPDDIAAETDSQNSDLMHDKSLSDSGHQHHHLHHEEHHQHHQHHHASQLPVLHPVHHPGTVLGHHHHHHHHHHQNIDQGYHDPSGLRNDYADVDSSHLLAYSTESLYGAPDRKRRKGMTTENQNKRFRYDVLKSFFRVYFQPDEKSSVLKDAVFNLYLRKIPLDAQIARNAFYRHMWSFFKEKVSCSQSNYREYVRGLRLVITQPQITAYSIAEKDFEVLRNIGVTSFFDFTEEEITKEKVGQFSAFEGDSSANSPTLSSSNSVGAVSSEDSNADILIYLDQIENQAKTLFSSIQDLRQRILKRKDLEEDLS